MALIYDPISGKNLTASQLQNRINSPNLGAAYAKAGVKSVDEVKNYNSSANRSSSSSSSSAKPKATIIKTADDNYVVKFNDGSMATASTEDHMRGMLGDRYGVSVATSKMTTDAIKTYHENKYADKIAERAQAKGFAKQGFADKISQNYYRGLQNNPSYTPEKLQVKDEYAQYVGQREGRVVDGIAIPKWVDDDYLHSYVVSAKRGNPRGPNSRELTEMQAGVPIEQLYGTMHHTQWSIYTSSTSKMLYSGVTKDTRNWNKILNNAIDPLTGDFDNNRLIAAASEAKAQMYGGISIQQKGSMLFFVGGNGTVLTSVHSSQGKAMNDAKYYGIRDISNIGQEVQKAMIYGNNKTAELQQALAAAPADKKQEIQDQIDAVYTNMLGLQSMQKAYTPEYISSWKPFGDSDFSSIYNDKYVDQVAPQVVSQPTQQIKDQPDDLGIVEQTIQSPKADPLETKNKDVEQPTYQEQPTATGNTGTTVDTAGTGTTTGTTTTPFTPFTPEDTTVQTGIQGTGIYPMADVTGTTSTPLQTAGLGAVPETIQVRDNYTGTTMQNLTSQSQQGFGGQRTYVSPYGQEILVTVDAMGKPITYVPPDYTLKMAEGGSVPDGGPDVQLARKFLGFDGPASQLTNFLASNPAAAARMGKYQQAMAGMANNRVGAAPGTVGTSLEDFTKMQGNLLEQTMQPTQSTIDKIVPAEADMIGTTAGQATNVAPQQQVGIVENVTQSQMPMTTDASTYTASTTAGDVQAQTDELAAQTGTLSAGAQVDAQQQLTTSVSGMEAAQGTATMVNAPAAREIQDGEIISGVADAEKAATFNEQIQAATATPTKQATVAGQLEGLMQQFEGGNTPPWAAGSMRTAMQTLAARGLGASSMAGQAVIQAAMEAALPIAQIDAQTQAQFESQNLSNRQQRAILAAQQRAQFLGQEFDQAFQARVQNSARIADIANMNFNAEQQIALENSRAANSMNMANLTNRQAMVMAEAAALANLDMANLNNRQQAAVQNAQNFLQMDMANLSNQQQTAMFKAQQNIQALFTDQAAENAAAQFNATSENQTNQFFANLSAQVSQFNAAQQNAMDQFNVNSTNAMRQYNGNLQQQRDLFNAQNGLVVAQANAQWRQNIATLNQAAQNESNMDFAKTINALTSTNLDNIWQRERDIMSYAFTAQQSALDRSLQLLLGDKKIAEIETQLSGQKDAASTELAFRFLFGSEPDGIFGGLFNKPE